jgi:protein TonB
VPVDPAERKGRRPSRLPADDAEIEDPRVISSPAPVYPEAARASGVYAMISVSVLVDETGKVIDAKVKGAFVDGGSGGDFRKAALDAAWKARFDPATRNGVPIKMLGELTYEFGTKKP